MPEGGPDQAEAMKQLEVLMSKPEGMALLQELESKPSFMAAAMDIAANGEAAAAKYEDNPEVIEYLQRLEDAMIPPIERSLSRAAVLLAASDLRLKSLRLNTFCSIDYTLIRISHRHQRFDNPEDPAPYL